MSLALVPEPEEQHPQQSRAAQEPPHDIRAEQNVLGGMMLSKDAIAEVVEITGSGDFYRPAHQVVFDSVVKLHGDGAPTDAIAVNKELAKRGQAKQVGGAAYLHTLTEAIPVAANAGYYARIVAEAAVYRRLVEAGTHIAQLGFAAEGDAGEAAAQADEALRKAREAGGAWSEPTPLDAVSGQLPEFPVEALPSWVGLYAAAVSDLTQTPPDLAGCLSLAALSTAASGRIHVDTGTWTEPACVYTVTALPPASRKSAVFAHINSPLFHAEQKLVEQVEPEIRDALLQRRVAQAQAEEAAQKAEKEGGSPQAMAEARDAADRAAELEVPAIPKLIASDITPENLAHRLAEQNGRLALLAPEGGFFGNLAGRYSGMPNLDTFLNAHAGEQIRVDRQGREPDYIDAPALTIGIALQPEALNEIFSTPGGRGRGVFARILYSLPPDNIGHRSSKNAAPIPAEVDEEYRHQLKTMLFSLRNLPEPMTLTFTDQARERLMVLMDEVVEPQLRSDGRMGQMRDWGGKLVGAVVRIAALLHVAEHLADGWGAPITLETLTAAEKLGEYYTEHALAVFGLMGADPVHNAARKVLDWLEAHPRRQVTHRDLYNGVRCRDIPKSSDLDAPVGMLIDLGWLRLAPPPAEKKRGRPSKTYLVHPKLRQKEENPA